MTAWTARGQGRGRSVGPVNLALWGIGVALIAVGYLRAKGPWERYQSLKSQQ